MRFEDTEQAHEILTKHDIRIVAEQDVAGL
jgi:hypothetical protein